MTNTEFTVDSISDFVTRALRVLASNGRKSYSEGEFEISVCGKTLAVFGPNEALDAAVDYMGRMIKAGGTEWSVGKVEPVDADEPADGWFMTIAPAGRRR